MCMTEHSLCTLQNQVMDIVVVRSSSGYPGSIMKLVSHRRALNGLLTEACPPMGMSLQVAAC